MKKIIICLIIGLSVIGLTACEKKSEKLVGCVDNNGKVVPCGNTNSLTGN
jgi:phosphoheptose isomerase